MIFTAANLGFVDIGGLKKKNITVALHSTDVQHVT